ncbi:MAG: lasso peptide biosynthesis B2 protein [Methylobacteriaceae bacterium]|nr:lasso peptide biosynthesis B2 protein [Methylobacteriaceae bacterium]
MPRGNEGEPGEPRGFAFFHAAASRLADKSLRLREGVLLIAAEDGSGRLVDLDGEVSALSTTGMMMLEGALRGGPDEASQALAKTFRAEVGQIRGDMAALLAALECRRLLATPRDGRLKVPSLAGVVCWLVAPFLSLCACAPGRLLRTKAWILLTLACLSMRLFGWPNTVRVWRHATPRREDRRFDHSDGKLLDTIEAVVTGTISSHPCAVSCKERALCCHALARAAGAPSKIVLGVDLVPFAMHCWCECGSRILADRYDGNCDRFTPVIAYS